MKISYSAILFVLYILAIPYSIPVRGFFGVAFLGLAIMALPVISSRIQYNQLSILTGIWLLACAATAVAMISYPEPRIEYFKCVVYFGLALAASYIAFLFVLSLTQGEISNVCFAILIVALLASTLEVLFPAARQASEKISTILAPGGGTASAGEQWIEMQTDRDERENGGRPRPLLGTVEPGRVGFLLAIVLTGWNLTRIRMSNNRFLFMILAGWGLVVTRSPTFLTMLLAGNLIDFCRMAFSRSIGGVIAVITFVSALVLASTIAQERVAKIATGEDYSINIRFFLPFSFAQIVLQNTHGMGIGFIGEVGEPEKRELDVFLPMLVEAMKRSNTLRLYNLNYSKIGMPVAVAHAAFATHWAFYGIPFGILALLLWRSFTKTIGPRLFLPFLISLFFVGVSGFPYETVTFWIVQMVIFGFIVVHEDIRRLHVQSVNL